MPIMAVQDQNDVRGSTRVLAGTAKRYIADLPADNRHVPAMNGVFRLLKVYRASKFEGYQYQPGIDRGPDAVYMLPAPNRHFAELREALEQALAEAAHDQELDVTIDMIQDVLRRCASGGDVDAERRRTTTAFLDSLLIHLTPAA